jgi:quinoprotein glucose dehydrogenase
MATTPAAEKRSARTRAFSISAAVIGLIGLAILFGGVWLAAIGGSLYYLLCGAGIIATSVLLFLRKREALWLYALIIVATVIWAVAEIGFDWWPLVPRGDVIFLIGLYLCLPFMITPLIEKEKGQRRRMAAAPVFGALAIAAVVGVTAIFSEYHSIDGEVPAALGAIPASYAGVKDGDWRDYGGSLYGDKWSPLTQITPANVSQLKVAWTYRTGDSKGPGDPNETTQEVTPIKVGDTVYICTPHDRVVALDAETGKEKWRYDPKIQIASGLQHLTCRGVAYHDAGEPGATAAANSECPQRIFVPTADARLIALDAHTGQLCRSFGQNGTVNLWAGMPEVQPGWYYSTSSPLSTRKAVIVAGNVSDDVSIHVPSGVIRAFDPATGRLLWNFDPGNPDSSAPIGPGQHYSWSSPNSWSTASADEALGMAYFPMGMGAVDQWGGTRPPTTEKYATSILALDLATGRPRWVFQTVHHDLWDMDVPAQPSLIDLDRPGGRVPALIQATKTGNLWVLDRRTGQPIFPVEERPVPQGAAPGDRTSPTQPYSALSLMPQERIREKDMWGATLLQQLACRIRFHQLRYDGPFTPPSLKGSLVYPGNYGVTDWGGIAVDPVRQMIFSNPNYIAFVSRLLPTKEGVAEGLAQTDQAPPRGFAAKPADEHGFNANAGAPFAVDLNPFLSPIGFPCQAPPWGYVAGIDLRTGKTVWKHKNGTVRDEAAVPLPFKMGVPSLGGPIVTAGGIGFLTSALDYYIRAYDMTSGKVLWRDRLPAGGQSTPMSYRSPSGRQMVVTMAGGHGSLGTKMGDYLIAYALPQGTH